MDELSILLKKLEKLHPKYIDLSLFRINKLLKKLNNPHLRLPPCIHIAGTNGKGSILNFIKNIMIESNYKVHAYLSPHLEKINERYIVSNKVISNKKLYKCLRNIKNINSKDSVTFYEITTAAAFFLFNKYPADFVLLETGLGGRLDATNVLNDNLLSVITPIGLDHQEFLGNSLHKITKEKLAIIKKNSVVVSSKQKKFIQKKINDYTKKNNNKIISYGINWKIDNFTKKYFYIRNNKKITKYKRPTLLGDHQIYNASTAIMVINYLTKIGYKFYKKNIDNGISKTIWPGRLEVIRNKRPTIIIDGAHNIEGAKVLRNYIIKTKLKTWIILGMLNTKDINSFLKILKNSIHGIIAINIANEKNSFSKFKIKKICNNLNIFCFVANSPNSAVKKIVNDLHADQIIITGSLYLIGEVRKNVKLLNQSIQ